MLVSILSNLVMQPVVPARHGTQTSTLLDEGGKSHIDKDLLELSERNKKILEDDEEVVLLLAAWLTSKNNN